MLRARLLPYVWYPAGLLAAVAGYAALLAVGAHLYVALYVPVVAIYASILILESIDPERRDWRPRRRDVLADAAFLAVVQILLPRILATLAVLTIARMGHDAIPAGFWPHDWPIAGQTLLMLLLVDCMRYWLHRACHRAEVLWRLHEVHHAPPRLYALNAGRFHPLEKTLHFVVDSVPFLLLGVAPEVIAGYFLIYAVNGAFQHSNIRLRYGWLNFLVGSAQTHRWHHAKDPGTANCNFGTTTVLWDLICGTWYLPRSGRVAEVGVPDDAYPQGFLAQMGAPFRKRRGNGTPHGAGSTMNRLVRTSLLLARRLHGWRIARQAVDPMRVQRALLTRIIRDNRATGFGRRCGFSLIDDYAAFARRVPVSDYRSLRPLIESGMGRDGGELTAARPKLYTRTGETKGEDRNVPLVGAHLRALRRIHRAAIAFQHRNCPQAFDGAILSISEGAVDGVLLDGRPYGAPVGVIADGTPLLVREKFVVPPEVLRIGASRVRQLAILRLALARPDITCMTTADPATLVELMRLYREHVAELIEDVRRGGFFLKHAVPADAWAAMEGGVGPGPERAEELARLRSQARLADLWPRLHMLVTWTARRGSEATAALARELSPRTCLFELGHVAGEFRGTLTLGRRPGTGFPTIDTHFFEFVERERWDKGEVEFLTIDQLRKGGDYYVLVTTPSGLYRYFVDEIVRVTGRLHATPLLHFLGKSVAKPALP